LYAVRLVITATAELLVCIPRSLLFVFVSVICYNNVILTSGVVDVAALVVAVIDIEQLEMSDDSGTLVLLLVPVCIFSFNAEESAVQCIMQC